MAHPHIPPSPGTGPAPANVYTGPLSPEPIPVPNAPLSAERWDTDRFQVDQLRTALQRTHLDETSHLEGVASGMYRNASVLRQQHLDKILTERTNIQATIGAIARRSDTTEIARQLELAARSAKVSHNTAARATHTHNGRVTEAHRGSTARAVDYRTQSVRRNAGVDPAASDKALAEDLYKAAQARTALTDAARLASDVRWGTRPSQFDAVGNVVDGYHESLDTALNAVRQEQQRHLNEADTLSNGIHQGLERWDLTQTPAPGQEDAIRDGLREYADLLSDPDALSPHDSARAEKLGDYVRLRYRLEARSINHNTGAATYIADGGIRIDAGTPTETIIYPNGDTIRIGARETTRLRPNGTEPTEADLRGADLVSGADLRAGISVDQYVAHWEITRTPEAAADAHAALSEKITDLTLDESHFTGQIDQATEQLDRAHGTFLATTDRINHNSGEIARRNHLIQTLRNAPNRTPAQNRELQELSREVQSLDHETRDLNLKVAQLKIQGRQLRADLRRAEDQRRLVRLERNPALYQQGFLEVGAHRPEAPAVRRLRKLGEVMLRKNVDRSIPDEPLLSRDGSLLWSGVTINGVKADWRLHPNGEASHLDANGNVVRYRSDGTII